MWRFFFVLALAGCASDAERGPGAGPACRYLALCAPRAVAMQPAPVYVPVPVPVPVWSPTVGYVAPPVRARIPCDLRGLATSGIGNTLSDCY